MISPSLIESTVILSYYSEWRLPACGLLVSPVVSLVFKHTSLTGQCNDSIGWIATCVNAQCASGLNWKSCTEINSVSIITILHPLWDRAHIGWCLGLQPHRGQPISDPALDPPVDWKSNLIRWINTFLPQAGVADDEVMAYAIKAGYDKKNEPVILNEMNDNAG